MRRILFILFFLPVMAWAGKDTPAKRLVSLLTECREREELVPDSFFSDVLLLKREIREQRDSAAKAVYSAALAHILMQNANLGQGRKRETESHPDSVAEWSREEYLQHAIKLYNYALQDLELLHKLGVQNKVRQILVRRIEHTETSQPKLKKLSQACIEGYEECITWVKQNYPNVIFTVPILKDVFRGGNNEYFIEAEERISMQKEIIKSFPNDTFINLISPLSGYEYFKKSYEDMPNVKVNLINNHLYGGSVSVAGLLNHGDIKEQFKPERNDVMILPSEMYNSEDVDILGEPREELSRYYKAKVIAV